MPRRSREPLTKVTWRIFSEDLLYLQANHSDVNTPIRALIHSYVERAMAREAEAVRLGEELAGLIR